jgi:hypothetical protein
VRRVSIGRRSSPTYAPARISGFSRVSRRRESTAVPTFIRQYATPPPQARRGRSRTAGANLHIWIEDVATAYFPTQ